MDKEQRIDKEAVRLVDEEICYWTAVLKRVVEVVRFLSELGLPFRGENDKLGFSENGNFLRLLELIGNFDPFLKKHLEKYGNKGRDSTPDLSHVDQLTIVLRYCFKGKVIERFLGFIPISSHSGEYLSNTVLSMLEENTIDLENCRDQTYDNASNMSGKYQASKFLQKTEIDMVTANNLLKSLVEFVSNLRNDFDRIKEKDSLAVYVPCVAHSLNLVGECSVSACLEVVKFFLFLQKLYAFCAGSTHRWSVLKKYTSKSIKSLSETRWSCRYDAVLVLYVDYDASKFLQKTEIDMVTANNLLKSLVKFVSNLRNDFDRIEENAKEISKMVSRDFSDKDKPNRKRKFTDKTVEDESEARSEENTIDLENCRDQTYDNASNMSGKYQASKFLQKTEIDMVTANNLLKSLVEFVSNLRNDFDRIKENAREISKMVSRDYSDNDKRNRKRTFTDKTMEDESEARSGRDLFRTATFLIIIDKLKVELERRSKVYEHITNMFGFFTKLDCIKTCDLKGYTERLLNIYPKDLDSNLESEINHLVLMLKSEFGKDLKRKVQSEKKTEIANNKIFGDIKTVIQKLLKKDLLAEKRNVQKSVMRIINKKFFGFVLAMRIVGGGLESLRSFCGVMDFPAPVQNSSFTKIRKQVPVMLLINS
ncbi:hypothetical protein TSAR_002121 [Trichomalopsis sarcophagae]|uniref:DUF4371 domain-containing protein n=1 Tax=Trichomalopsis sarcophagae TaxID=543379 RepID=A0A232EE93_9HYME|nr:hypothetical protein TSAR_002121 [Trichomalopsis sarcophagae]